MAVTPGGGDSVPPSAAAPPKLQPGVGEPPGFPGEPCALGGVPWGRAPHLGPRQHLRGAAGGKQTRSPEMSHGSADRPYPRVRMGDPGGCGGCTSQAEGTGAAG